MNAGELSADPAAAKRLGDLMYEISEGYWSAAWMKDLEHSLWRMVQGGPRDFGFGRVTDAELDELKALSERCQGWWRWDDNHGEVFVSLDEWRQMAR